MKIWEFIEIIDWKNKKDEDVRSIKRLMMEKFNDKEIKGFLNEVILLANNLVDDFYEMELYSKFKKDEFVFCCIDVVGEGKDSYEYYLKNRDSLFKKHEYYYANGKYSKGFISSFPNFLGTDEISLDRCFMSKEYYLKNLAYYKNSISKIDVSIFNENLKNKILNLKQHFENSYVDISYFVEFYFKIIELKKELDEIFKKNKISLLRNNGYELESLFNNYQIYCL